MSQHSMHQEWRTVVRTLPLQFLRPPVAERHVYSVQKRGRERERITIEVRDESGDSETKTHSCLQKVLQP